MAKEEEEIELARQANELAEMARQQTEELQNGEDAAVPVEIVSIENEEPVVEEAPESPAIDEPQSPTEVESPAIVEEIEPATEEPVEE